MILRNRKNRRYAANHIKDYFTDLGYDYRGHIYEKSISPEILKNENNTNIEINDKIHQEILSYVENMLVFLIDAVKQIKLTYLISLDKNDRNVN